jgi:restriction system protein
MDDGTQCYLSLEDDGYVVVHDREDLCIYRGPDVLLRTSLLHFGDRTDEGVLVKSAALPWFEILKKLSHNPDFRFQFTRKSRKFEELLAGAYRQSGWDEVVLTPATADKGRDVIASTSGMRSIRIVEQAKAYSAGRRVSHNDVRAILGVRSIDARATECGITTTSDFAPTIRSGAEFRNEIASFLKLTDGAELLRWLNGILSLTLISETVFLGSRK